MWHRSAPIALLAVLTTGAIARADTKFAYVDLQRALSETKEGQDAKKRLQKVLEDKQKDLDKEQEALKKEKENLDKQAAVMSEETRTQKMGEFQQKLMTVAQKYEKGKQEMAAQERNELQSIFKKMDPIIATIAQREGFTMVFEKTDSGLVYAPAALDLTNELVRTFNEQNKASGGAGSSTSKSPAATKSDAKK